MKKFFLSFLVSICWLLAQAQQSIPVTVQFTCDCNTKNVLSTISLIPEAKTELTVPKDGSFSFNLEIPEWLKRKGVKMEAASENVTISLQKKNNNTITANFNKNGIANFKNIKQGIYNVSIQAKGGRNGNGCPGDFCKCLIDGGCYPCDEIPEKVPKENPHLVSRKDVYCPTGKYDANGNCIFNIKTEQTQSAKSSDPDGPWMSCPYGCGYKIPQGKENEHYASAHPKQGNLIDGSKASKTAFSSFGVDLGYIVSSNNNNPKEGKPLFAGNGVTGGISYRYGGVLGGVIKTRYATGSIDKSSLTTFAKTFGQNGFTARTTTSKTNWSQVIVAGGPSVLFPRYKGELSFIGGVSMGSANTVKVDLYDVNTFYKNVYTATEKKGIMYWEVAAKYKIAQIKKIRLDFRGGFGSNGGVAGLTAVWCIGCGSCYMCARCYGSDPAKACGTKVDGGNVD